MSACLTPGTPVFEAWQQALHAVFVTLCHRTGLNQEERNQILDHLDRSIEAYGVEEYTEC